LAEVLHAHNTRSESLRAVLVAARQEAQLTVA
jgi:hypothetical protein